MRLASNFILLLIAVVAVWAWAFLAVPALKLGPLLTFAISFLIGQALSAWVFCNWRET